MFCWLDLSQTPLEFRPYPAYFILSILFTDTFLTRLLYYLGDGIAGAVYTPEALFRFSGQRFSLAALSIIVGLEGFTPN